jgi:16S rRNA A1518/A1519 N6-dimethyltransferase RsmA/KsgA/DIM1 with predicted DNA glycosylase/AP lyase activity
MVGTNLDKKTLSDILKKMGLSEKVRAQELSVQQWQKLSKLLRI